MCGCVVTTVHSTNDLPICFGEDYMKQICVQQMTTHRETVPVNDDMNSGERGGEGERG